LKEKGMDLIWVGRLILGEERDETTAAHKKDHLSVTGH
jgi:hypothetical protein